MCIMLHIVYFKLKILEGEHYIVVLLTINIPYIYY